MMDFQQKARALAGLTELKIIFREPQIRIGRNEPWYVCQNVDIRDDCILIGALGNGFTPEEAIDDHWKQLVDDLKPSQYLVVRNADMPTRRVRWNGFMWADVHIAPNEVAA